MRVSPFHLLGSVLVLCISAILALPQGLFAQDHVVSPADIRNALESSTATRQKEVAEVNQFLSSKEARDALQSAHLDYQQIQKAVPSLSDEDLARISARTEQIQTDFAAGFSNHDLLWLVAIGVLIIILVLIFR